MSAHALTNSPELESRPTLAAIARVLSKLSYAALYLAGVGLIAMSVIVFWQVFTRYVLNSGQAWTELSSIMIMGWFIFLGAAVGVRESFHLGFDVLIYVLPKGSKKILRTISDLVVLSFAIGMIYYGIVLMRLQWAEVMPSLGISGAFRYLPLTAGGVLISLFSLERILLRWSGIDIDRDPYDEGDLADPADAPLVVKEI
ncbi:TRAP transporter small permease [Mesorhizobium sp. CAU 1732]|uniref:TRAP transporter small permease n=1 Tax=Mesorhizobium sp. CAU 1732 TaxID=3140358 RepID=UPI0032602B5C